MSEVMTAGDKQRLEGQLAVLRGKHVLVTGAAGFVGSHLTRRLLSLGASVTILVRTTSDKEIVKEFAALGAKVLYGDITDRDSVLEAVRGQEYVFHIAALFRQAKFPDRVYFEINVGGTRNVLDACCECATRRLVYCSTTGVHGNIENPPGNEESPYHPLDVYQESKTDAEKLVKSYVSSGKIDAVIVRPAMIWGEGDTRTLKIFRGVSRRRFPIIGDGRTLCHWIYVGDLANAFMLAAITEAARGQTYIVAGIRSLSLTEIVEVVAREAGVKPLPLKIPAWPVQQIGSIAEMLYKPFGVEPPIYRRRVDFFVKNRCFDVSKSHRELGFMPENTLETEVKKIFSWYKKHGWLD